MTNRRLIAIALVGTVVLSLLGAGVLFGAIELPGERTISPNAVLASVDGRSLILETMTGACGPDSRATFTATATRRAGGQLVVTMHATNGWHFGLPSFGCSAVGVIHRATIGPPFGRAGTHGLQIIDSRTGDVLPVKPCDPNTC